MKPETKRFLEATGVLVGTIVGLGPFGIPYAFSRAGFLISMGYFALLAAVILLMHLLYGEIVLRTHAKHRLVGYAETYLGRWGKRLAAVVLIVGTLGTLLAYTVVGGIFSKVFFSPLFTLDAFAWSLIFFAVMAFFVITDLKTGAPAELAMSVALLGIFIVIIARTVPDISSQTLFQIADSRDLFLPYGVILFALSGGSAIPELRDVLRGDGKIRRVIIIGSLIPALLYVLFAFGVVGSMGTSVTEDAIAGLADRYGTWMAVLGGAVGILSTATSFIVIALVAKHSFMYDLGISRFVASTLVLATPLAFFVFTTPNFVKVIGFIGSVLMGLEAIILLKIHRVARRVGQRQPEYALRIPGVLYFLLGAMFVVGIVYEVVYAF